METFQELALSPNVLQAIQELGYHRPSAIQAQAIPLLMNSQRDFIGQAQTGTGKTAAFLIPLLEKLDPAAQSVQALILTPTRELALQVEAEFQKLNRYHRLKSLCVYGGAGYGEQLRGLKHDQPQIVVGTPGRTIDLIQRKALKLGQVRFCILDEADEMLNMGFFEDVKTILSSIPQERRLIMFSATMSPGIIKLIDKTFQDYDRVQVKNPSLSNDDIEQKYFVIKEKYFKESLARLIDHAPQVYGLIFCRTRAETLDVGGDLKKRGHKVEILNGDMGQGERERAMRNFREKKSNLMVCTDVAARGIDVNNLSHVFNYGLPQDNESYVHRIGRTGRAGMKGKAYTIVGPTQAPTMRKLERFIQKKIVYAKLPRLEELKEQLVAREIEDVQYLLQAITSKGSDFKTDHSFELFEREFAGLSREQLLKLMFTWKLNKTFRHYLNLPDIECTPTSRAHLNFPPKGKRRHSRSRPRPRRQR